MRLHFIPILLAAAVTSTFLPLAAQAQLYTWRDAQGNLIIKNAPPPWYSESERVRGARVQVLRNGFIVDDTAWPAERRQDSRNKDARDQAKRAESETATSRKEEQKPPPKDDDD
jgi:hypothetical protein